MKLMLFPETPPIYLTQYSNFSKFTGFVSRIFDHNNFEQFLSIDKGESENDGKSVERKWHLATVSEALGDNYAVLYKIINYWKKLKLYTRKKKTNSYLSLSYRQIIVIF